MCIWTFLFYHLFESLDSRIFIAGLPMLHDKIRTILSVANWTRHDFMDNMEKEGITMLYVYDILLNFTDVHTYLNFFEWENKKELTHVKKIPLLKIPNYQLKEIYENRIQLQDAIWAKLQGKAKASGKMLRQEALLGILFILLSFPIAKVESVIEAVPKLILIESI